MALGLLTHAGPVTPVSALGLLSRPPPPCTSLAPDPRTHELHSPDRPILGVDPPSGHFNHYHLYQHVSARLEIPGREWPRHAKTAAELAEASRVIHTQEDRGCAGTAAGDRPPSQRP